MSNEIEKLWESIRTEDLPDPYGDIADLIGKENTLLLASSFSGTTIYLPKLNKVTAKIRNAQIRKEFNGGNYKQLAKKYGVSEAWVRIVVKGKD